MRGKASKPPARNRVLRTALNKILHSRRGPSGEAAVGSAVRSLKRYFLFYESNREPLELPAMDAFFSTSLERLREGLQDEGPGALERLFLIFEGFRDAAVEHVFRDGRLLGEAAKSAGAQAPGEGEEVFELLVGHASVYFELAKLHGELPEDLDPVTAALIFVSAFNGLLLELKAYKDASVYLKGLGALGILFGRERPTGPAS